MTECVYGLIKSVTMWITVGTTQMKMNVVGSFTIMMPLSSTAQWEIHLLCHTFYLIDKKRPSLQFSGVIVLLAVPEVFRIQTVVLICHSNDLSKFDGRLAWRWIRCVSWSLDWMDVFFPFFLWGPNQRLCQLGPSRAGRQSLPVVIVNVYPHSYSATCLMTVEMEDQMNRTARLVRV